MKTSKFFFAAMMAAAVAVSFTACDPKDNGGDIFGGGDNNGGDNGIGGGDTTTEYLTVEQAIAQQGSGVKTVKGYIVGYYNVKPNPGECVFSADAPADTTVNKANVLIADAADCMDASKVLCVQLTAGAVRSLVNLGENPGNLGKEVKITGSLETYNTLPGMKTTSYAEIEGKTSDDYAVQFYCYRVGLGDLDASVVGALKVGDKVVLTAKIVNYKGTTPETVTKTGSFVSINGEVPAEAKTAAEAIEIAKGLGADVESEEVYTIAGEVTQITENAASTYSNMTFYIK
ncbi:MAG: DUF6359 domain-containing protein [Paludibacteraceae bacterium]